MATIPEQFADWFHVKLAASELDCSPQTIARMVDRNDLRGEDIGQGKKYRRLMIDPQTVQNLKEKLGHIGANA